jgi:hypothetical protein
MAGIGRVICLVLTRLMWVLKLWFRRAKLARNPSWVLAPFSAEMRL